MNPAPCLRRMWVALVVAWWAGAALAQQPQVLDLPTRPGITVRLLVLQPEAPTAVVVLLTGGNGRLGIFDHGGLRNDGNFLVRSRSLLVQRGLSVVLMDTPSDRSSPPFLGGKFRESEDHVRDLGAVVAWARQRFNRPVWLAGTSRGTHSATHGAIALEGAAAPDGILLSSSILADSRVGTNATPVQRMAVDKLRVPVLVQHHENDQCQVCQPAALPQLMSRLSPATSRLVVYQGGRSEGPPCEAQSHHGFKGIEEQVVADMADWIAQGPRR